MRAVHAGPKPNADHRDEAGRGFESDQVNFGGRIEGYSRLVLRTKYIASNTAAKSINWCEYEVAAAELEEC